MDDQKARKESAIAFVNYSSKLDKDIYEHLMRLVVKVGHRALTPNSFRAKIKYLLRDSWDLIPILINPLLPDEYQLSQEELLPKKAEDYKKLEIIEKYIIFVNQLKREVETSQALLFLLELIKSHQRKEIDAKELYGKMYNQLGGDFGLMKQLSDILDEKLTPSYISVPVQLWETSMSEDGVLNNNRLRIDNRLGAVEDIQKVDSNYLYEVDALIKKYLGSTPKAASSWMDDRRHELDLLHNKLELAEKEVQRVIKKIHSGELNEESALSKHLRGHSVRVRLRLVKKMFPKLEELMCKSRESFQYVLEVLRKRKLHVSIALLQINRNIYKSRIRRHV